jgi:hypothetical protein
MNDFVKEFFMFIVQAAISYGLIRLLLILLSIRIVRVPADVPNRLLPITIERVGNQFYCYDKQNNWFLAQGRDRDEIVERLKQQFPDRVIYVDGGDPNVIDEFGIW